jgi:metal-responsive CopG/Arc/MetJ family transcriptional regulator
MPRIHVSVAAELLREAVGAARRLKISRSKLVRDAVRTHLKRTEDERDRRAIS